MEDRDATNERGPCDIMMDMRANRGIRGLVRVGGDGSSSGRASTTVFVGSGIMRQFLSNGLIMHSVISCELFKRFYSGNNKVTTVLSVITAPRYVKK